MGLYFPAHVACDYCHETDAAALVLTRLQPAVAMYMKLPEGWTSSTKPESGELHILCPKCRRTGSLVTGPPVRAPTPSEVGTMRPPKRRT